MLKNYLRVAWRQLYKHKGYTGINIAGLAVGMACCLLIALFVQDELSYDRHHEHADQIHRLAFSPPGTEDHVAVSAAPVGPALVASFPEVLEAARFVNRRDVVVRHGDAERFHEDGLLVEPSILDIFSIPFLRGNPETALHQTNEVVISQHMAAKHFGTEEALGAVLTFDLGGEERDFQVVGVVEDVPRNAHFHFDFLLPFSLVADQSNRMDNWVTNWLYTYVLLDKEASPDQLEAKLPAFFEAHVADFPFTYAMQPITDIHLNP